MKMDSAQVLGNPAQSAGPVTTTASPEEVFQQVGVITRQLHDTLEHLGVMPKLKSAADGLPDARSRLSYIANKTAAAADKVLNSVDQAKAEHARLVADARRLMAGLAADPIRALGSGAISTFLEDVEASTSRVDAHLTDIMLAQDFHDLTGQVVAKVVGLANELEDSLVKLLVSVVPPEQAHKVQHAIQLNGPVVDTVGRTDIVANQGEVDDLLASLGF